MASTWDCGRFSIHLHGKLVVDSNKSSQDYISMSTEQRSPMNNNIFKCNDVVKCNDDKVTRHILKKVDVHVLEE